MQEITTNEFSLKPIEGVLLTRQHLEHHKKAQSLYNQARNKAQIVLKKAESEAQDIRNQAIHQGYEEGTITCVEEITDYLISMNNLNQNFLSECFVSLRNVAEEFYYDAQIVKVFSSTWLDNYQSKESGKIKVRLPSHKKDMACLLNKFISERGFEASFEYDDKPGINMKLGDFILELSPERISAGSTEKIIKSGRDYVSCASQLSEKTRDKIIELLTSIKDSK